MSALCGANCDECMFNDKCVGCENSDCKPFGGKCIAGEYIKVGGLEAYHRFKEVLLGEVNHLLALEGLPGTPELNELAGFYVNLAYPLPGGGTVKFLEDKNIYLGCQIEVEGLDKCVGVIVDMGFILICCYGENGSDPELILYKKR